MLWILKLSFLWSLSWAFPHGNMLECHYKGHNVVLLSERLQFDGKDVLVLDKENNIWISTQDPELTSVDIQHILEECEEPLKKLSALQSEGRSVFGVVVSVLSVLVFLIFCILSFTLSKRYARDPGGVLGSIVHYPAHFLKEQSEKGPNTI